MAERGGGRWYIKKWDGYRVCVTLLRRLELDTLYRHTRKTLDLYSTTSLLPKPMTTTTTTITWSRSATALDYRVVSGQMGGRWEGRRQLQTWPVEVE